MDIRKLMFDAIRDELTSSLAAMMERELAAMGEDAKGISWFSSAADRYTEARREAGVVAERVIDRYSVACAAMECDPADEREKRSRSVVEKYASLLRRLDD